MLTRNRIWNVITLGVIVSLLLTACAAPTPKVVREKVVETVVVEKEVEAPVEKEVEKVITATPAPTPTPLPEKVEDFADVPEDVLVQVCEDVKKAVEYDDEAGTVTIHLQESFGPMMQFLANGWTVPLDQEWMAEQGGWDGSCETWVQFHDPPAEESVLFDKVNGTGPFKLERWKKGEETSFVRNEDYYRTEPIWEGGPSGPPALERAVIKSVDEWGTRYAMVEAGDTDLTYVPRQYAEQMDPLVAEECDYKTEECEVVNPDGTVRLYPDLPSVSGRDMFFNFDIDVEGGNPYVGSGSLDGSGIPPDFFSDIHIRKGFNYCFDWDTLIEESELGEAEQRLGPIINPMLGYHEDDFHYSLDLEKAAEEFKKADLDGDGTPAGEDEDDVWETGFHMIITYNTGNVQRRTTAEILKANLEAVNEKFEIELLAIPWPTYLKGLVAGRLPLFIIGWIEDYHHPHNWVHPYMHPNGAFAEFQHYPDDLKELFKEKIEEAKGITDPEEADAAYHEIQQLAIEKAIDIFLIQPIGRHYEQKWVQAWYYNAAYPGVYFYPLGKSEEASNPDTMIVTTIGEQETCDPAWMYDTASSEVILQTYDPLIFMKRERYDEFVPAIAESWEISDDGKTYTFHIRDGVTFHNGDPLKAHHAAYAIWRGMLQDRSGGPQWMTWEPIMGIGSAEGYAIEKANEMAGVSE
ncbi:MAG: ABC transporter substrate-binding protein [Chloroflexota bacterium]|nr:ABC transporter substrate-binding protein [Chloroflexota bacterium]